MLPLSLLVHEYDRGILTSSDADRERASAYVFFSTPRLRELHDGVSG